LHLVAAFELVLFDPPAVDVGAVRAVQIGDGELVVAMADFGVVARDFGVVDLDSVRRIASELLDGPIQLEPNTLIDSPDHE
jgi:hypothetical protein